MKYLSICDGIGAAHEAFEPQGWQCVGASEIEKFPIAVVNHHRPHIPHLGDMTKYHDWNIERPDLVCGGTPCQAFSVAGLRAGLADPRGNLALVFLGIVDRFRPRWVVWENVPGVYSATSHEAPDIGDADAPVEVGRAGGEVDEPRSYRADEDHAFACFLAGLQELGYGCAWRTLDAQYAGVPQRRRRCFLVGYLGDWRPSAAVLFEPHSLSGDPAPRREAGKGVAGSLASRSGAGGGLGTDFDLDRGLQAIAIQERAVSENPNAGPQGKGWQEELGYTLEARHHSQYVARTLKGEGFDASEDGKGRGTPLVPEVSGTLAPNTGPNGNDAGNFASNQGVDAGMIVPEIANPLTHPMGKGVNTTADEGQTMVAHAFKFRGGGNSTGERGGNTGQSGGTGYLGQDECAFTVATSEDQMVAIPFAENSRSELRIEGDGKRTGAQSAGGGKAGQGAPMIATRYAVRRLTPRECERLMSFPDDFTRIPWRGKPAEQCPDGPRYKALGNSWVVNEVKKLARKIQMVEEIKNGLPSACDQPR